MLTFVSQVLSTTFDISGSEEVRSAAKFLKKKQATPLANKKASAWEVPSELDATQLLPRDILQFISTTLEDYLLCEMCGHFLDTSPLV